MAAPTVFASAVSNPGGTGNTLTVSLSTHAVDDYLLIFVANTGNALWTGNPTDWNRLDQRSVGNAGNGVIGTWLWHKVVSGDTLPLADPVCTLGATSTRAAICLTIRGADLEGAFTLPEWGARGFATGNGNPVSPPTLTTVAPEMLVLHCYGQRASTDAPDPTDYTQDQEIIISGTLVLNASRRTISDQDTTLSNQDASPASGARWAAGLLCIPSPDYVYYRSGSQALTAAGTSATPALPTGTSASDNRSNKDLIVATIECDGTPTIAPNTPADWTQIAGEWATTTSGDGTTVRKYWALYDGTLDRQFNRSTSGEIFVYFSTYRNTHQTSPIGAIEAQQNASSTTSTFPSLVRTATKSTVQATCVADDTPTFTAPTGWIERNDSNGVTCADQAFNASGTVSSASFTLSGAAPTACGLVEILAVPPPITTVERSASIDAVASIATTAQAFTVFERAGTVSATGELIAVAQFFSVFERSALVDAIGSIAANSIRALLRSVTVSATANIDTAAAFFTILERTLDLAATANIAVNGQALVAFERAVSASATGTIACNGVRLDPLAFPNTPILDDFNRANEGPPPSSNWTTGVGLIVGVLSQGHRVSSNAMIRAAGDSEAESHWNAAQFGPNAECYITVANATGFQALALSVRISDVGTGGADGYTAFIATGLLQISKTVNGSPTVLTSGNTHTVATGNKYGIQAVGNVIRLWCDSGSGWEQLLSADDSALTSAGFIGIYTGSSTTTAFDDFGGGTFGVAETERAALVNATASVTVAGEFFSTFERSATLDGAASIVATGTRIVERAAACSATTSIESAAEFFTTFESSLTLDASASIESSGSAFSIIEVTTSLDATADVAVSGVAFSVVESAITLNVTASVESSAISFTITERTAAVDGAGSIVSAGARVVDRVASIDCTATVIVSAESFSIFESSLSLSVTGAIESSGAFFSIFDRRVVVNGATVITVSGQTEHNRQAAFSVVANISASGNVLPPGAVILERSAALEASSTITTSATFFSVVNRDVSLSATGAATVSAMRELQRQAGVGADATITTAGVLFTVTDRASVLNAVGNINTSGGVFVGNDLERATSFNAAGNITVSGETVSSTVSPIVVTRQSAFASPKITRGEFALIRTRNVTFQ